MVCSNCRGEKSLRLDQKTYCADCGHILISTNLPAATISKRGSRATTPSVDLPSITPPWIAKFSLLMTLTTGLVWLIVAGWLLPYRARWGLAAAGLFIIVWVVRSWLKNSLVFGLMQSLNSRSQTEETATKAGGRTLGRTLTIDIVALGLAISLGLGFYAIGLTLTQSELLAAEVVGLALGLLVLIWLSASLCAVYPLAITTAVLSHLGAFKSLAYAGHLYQHHLKELVATAFDALWSRAAMVMALILGSASLAAGIYKLDQIAFLGLAALILLVLMSLEYLSIRRNLVAWAVAYKHLAGKNALYPAGKLLAGSIKKTTKD